MLRWLPCSTPARRFQTLMQELQKKLEELERCIEGEVVDMQTGMHPVRSFAIVCSPHC